MRTILYARFSSSLQNSRSIADQLALLTERCQREGWEIVGVYTDHAISGAAGIDAGQRPGLAGALAAIDAGGIDQLTAESTDRIARHQGDLYAIMERLAFRGARLWTANDGLVDDITGTIKGLMDSRFRKELAAKTRRGQAGAVRAGRAAAGIAYGYRLANIIEGAKVTRGLRTVDPDQAAVVQRIFRRYAEGASPLHIAAELNADAIPAARGGIWTREAIAGQSARGMGILRNRLYIGEVSVGRTRKVTDPATRKTLIRPGDGPVVTGRAEHLRIIDDALWSAVQDGLEARSGPKPERHRRPRHLLSGLVKCGLCGGSYIVRSATNWACRNHDRGRACTNNRWISTTALEARAINGLAAELLDPAYVEEYVRTRRAEAAAVARDGNRRRAALTRRAAEAKAKVDRLIRALADGGQEFDEIRTALRAAKAEAAAAEAELAELTAHDVVALHPNFAAEYRRSMEDLAAALRDPIASNAGPLLRQLIDRVVITPHPTARGVEIRIEGRIANLLGLVAPTPAEPAQRTA